MKCWQILRTQRKPIALITETIDRLQRSFKESVILDEFRKSGKLEIHFIRESLILHKNSNSSELQRWDLGVFVARSYVLQLSDNVKRSLEQKVRGGEWPHKAPVGYKNITLENGQKDIVVDPTKDFLIVKMFELYASGNYSMLKLGKEMKKLGLVASLGKDLVTSQVERILKNPFYYGEMDYKEKIFQHRYEPLISRHLFNQVQEVRESYDKKPFKRVDKPFIFRGLITCPECNCLFTPELKKGRYVYYHCTNYYKTCTNKAWVKEERIVEQIMGVVRATSAYRQANDHFEGKVTPSTRE
jgi:site-specific DNA recombinase